MSDKTYDVITTYIDTNVNTNNANLITGAKMNVALNNLAEGLAGKLFDTTKPYKQGQSCIYQDATFGYEIWMADSDLSAGSWNSSNFTRLTKRTQKITASDTPYTGIEQGDQDYTHSLGHTDFIIQAFESSGAEVSLDIRTKTSSTIGIYSAVNFANAVILIHETIIP